MIFTDLFENTNQPLSGGRRFNEQRYKFQRIKFRGTDHDIGEERYMFAVNGNPLVFNFSSDEDNPDPDSPGFEEILARVQRDGAVKHLGVTPAEQQAIAKKIAAERQRYLDQRRQDMTEGHADQQRKIVKRNGQPVGEIGIDRESSPGVGQYYMKHYASGTDNSGYDSREEALDDLRHIMKQSVYGELRQGVEERTGVTDYNPKSKGGTRKELIARYHKTKNPKDAEAARKAGATQKELQGVAEAMKPSDIPPSMRDRLTMRDIEAERPQGAFRFRVTFPDGATSDFMDFSAAQKSAEIGKGRISRLA